MLEDPHEKVRSAVAKSLGGQGAASRKEQVVQALIVALDRPGEQARRSVCAALSTLTGRQMPYDPGAEKATRTKASWQARTIWGARTAWRPWETWGAKMAWRSKFP